ncbi:unnamed protein product [Microthlaspi erraticum]|uniref:Uncharacterized protein n=1 Tax=Microthlaspi erraticum TaxID=1685480 RepID=A0A6D2HNR5_9BRAS|nr:unnamed protein product [Microthlaspi erraticum]
MMSVLPDLRQFGLIGLIMSNLLVLLDDFSFMELVSLPNPPLGLSGVIAGSWSPHVSTTLVCVGSLARCFVTREFNAVCSIVKLALVAFSIPGVGLRKLSYFAQGSISLLPIVVVVSTGHLFDYGGLSLMLAPILVVYAFNPALFNAVSLAGLALLSFAWNNFSFNGE